MFRTFIWFYGFVRYQTIATLHHPWPPILRPSPTARSAPKDGHVCQSCSLCLDCDASLGAFTRALVKPGYKLGVAATEAYRGIERGKLHVNKVLHRCSYDMCTGETAQRVHRPYSVRVAITVSGVDPAVAGNGTDTRATFEAAFATAVAESFRSFEETSQSTRSQ